MKRTLLTLAILSLLSLPVLGQAPKPPAPGPAPAPQPKPEVTPAPPAPAPKPAPPAPAPVPVPPAEVYAAAGEWSVSPFTGWNITDLENRSGRQFTGLGVGYSLTKTVCITAEAAATDLDERAIDQFGSHFVGYLPVGDSGFAFYGELGWQRFTALPDHRDFMSTGAGLAVRGKHAEAKLGARWVQNFRDLGNAQVTLSAGFNF